MPSFQLSYDYRCPFAKNIHLHVVTALRAGADFDVEFVPWTMSQGYRRDGAPDVWDDPERDPEHLALAVSISIRDQQSEYFLVAHEALFRARHERGLVLKSWGDIEMALAEVPVDLVRVEADLRSRRPHGVLGDNFRRFEAYEAFGVPTFVLDNDATFVRYMKGPSDDANDSTALVTSLLHLMSAQRDLNEFKHTTVPY